MAHAMAHHQATPTTQLRNQHYKSQHSLDSEALPMGASQNVLPQAETYSEEQHWGPIAMYNPDFVRGDSQFMPQSMIATPIAHSYTSDRQMYTPLHTQTLTGGHSNLTATKSSWLPMYPIGYSRNMDGSASDVDNNSLSSPQSYASDLMGSDMPYTPGSSVPTASPSGDWTYSGPSSLTANQKSASMTAGYQSSPIHMNSAIGTMDMGLVESSPSVQAHAKRITAMHGRTMQHNLPGAYSHYSTAASGYHISAYARPLPLNCQASQDKQHAVQETSQQQQTGSGHSEISLTWNNPGIQYSSTNNRAQTYDQVSHAVDLHAQRKADDEMLLRGKRDGLTYKQIQQKMHVKCAESTLRGRYRTLTKDSKDRVRKPHWKKLDIELLNKFVKKELARVDAGHHQSLSYDQRLSKVHWKKVADYIEAKGGSYHFGNSTCKRKWMELHPRT